MEYPESVYILPLVFITALCVVIANGHWTIITLWALVVFIWLCVFISEIWGK